MVSFSLSFALPLIIVRVLPIEEFGRYRQVFLVVTTLAGIVPLGIGISSFYYLARDATQRSAAVFNIILCYLFAGGATFLALFLFPGILVAFFPDAKIGRLSASIGLLTSLWMFSQFMEYVATANREPRLGAVFIIGSQLSRTTLILFAAVWFGTVWSIVVASMVQGVLQSLVLLYYLARRFPKFWMTFEFDFLKEHLAYSLPMGIAGTIGRVQTDLHFFFVGYNFGLAEFAVYAVGCFQLPFLGSLSEAVNSVLISRMTKLQAANDRPGMIKLIAKTTRKLAVIYFPVFVYFFFSADTIIVLLFTEAYVDSVPIFRVFILILPFGALISESIVRAHKDLGQFMLKVRILSTVLLVVGLIFASTSKSLLAIVAVTVFVRLAELIVAEVSIFRKIGFEREDFGLFRGIVRIGLCSLAAGGIGAAVYWVSKLYLPTMLRGVLEGFEAGRNLTFLLDPLSKLSILTVSLLVFAVSYLLLILRLDALEPDEKIWMSRFKDLKFGRSN